MPGQKSLQRNERMEKLVALLQQRPGTYSTLCLARELGVNVRTVQRYLQALRSVGYSIVQDDIHGALFITFEGELPKSVVPLSDVTVRRAWHLHLLLQKGPASWDSLENSLYQRLQPEADRSEVAGLLRRDLEYLERRGLVVLVAGRYRLGRGLLPRLSMQSKELQELLTVISEARQILPYGSELDFLEAKVLAALERKPDKTILAWLNRRQERIVVQGPTPVSNSKVTRVLDQIQECVQRRYRVAITYQSPDGGISIFPSVRPLGVVYNAVLDCWFLVALLKRCRRPQHLRVNRIRGLKVEEETFPFPVGFDLQEYLRPSWATEPGQPQQVKVRFLDVHNIAIKVRSEVLRRQAEGNPAQITDNGGVIEFSDQIAGLQDFAHWLRRFGFAVEVLEPDLLRRRMARTAKRMLALYEGDEKEI